MKKSISKLALLVIAVCVFSQTGFAQFIEEVGTLESIYETKARDVLNSFLRPTDYSIVVSAELNRDEKKIEQYRNEMENYNLPGMPLPADAAEGPAANMLHELKAKIDIHLVIDNTIAPEKERIIKGILISKLHLDETAGDTIVIERSQFNTPQNAEPSASLLPDFTWKTWALIIILALLALAGLVYWINKRNQNKETPIQDVVPATEEEKAADEVPELAATATSDLAKDNEKILGDLELIQIKDHIISIVSQFPFLASSALQDHLLNGHEKEVIIFLEAIGWDLSKTLFKSMLPKVWGRIGAHLRMKTEKPQPQEIVKAINECYQLILSKYLEIGEEEDSENPFNFLFQATSDDRKRLVATEPIQNLALIALYCSKDQIAELFNDMNEKQNAELAVEVIKLESLPEQVALKTAQNLKVKLMSIQQNPVISAEGPELAARILRSLTPVQEIDIMEALLIKSPAQAEKLRTHILYFPDIVLFGSEIAGPVLESFDVETMRAAFQGLPAETLNALFTWLPKKKAYMVSRDIQEGINSPSRPKWAQARREIALALENYLVSKGLNLETYVKSRQNVVALAS